MDRLKVENIKSDYGFLPDYRAIENSEVEKIVCKLREKYCVEELENMRLLAEILKNSVSVSRANDDFNLEILLENIGIESVKEIMITWDGFKEIDKIRVKEFNYYFFDLWYEGIDNIALVDISCSWMMFILRNGDIRVSRCIK